MEYLKLLRPTHWIKNLLLFLPLFFAGDIMQGAKLEQVAYAFAVFSLSASTVYIINDLADREHDAQHEHKKIRPLASGKISPTAGIVLVILLFAAAALLTYFFVPAVWPAAAVYFVFNIFYSLYLKHVAILDLLLVVSFYLLRVIAGGLAADVYVSPWLILCTIFLALFLIVGKRKAEYRQTHQRRVLAFYTPEILDNLMILACALSIISYALYTVLVVNSDWAVYTVLLVMLPILRYALTAHKNQHSEFPELDIFSDKLSVISGIAWLAAMFWIFYK